MPEQNITNTDLGLLKTIAGLDGIPSVGAYNLRLNSGSAGRRSTKNIEITPKTDRPGIDIRIKPGVKDEDVHIPVIIDASGIAETVYNDFFVGEGADVTIIAGCGIHNDGCEESRHDGVHRFFIGKDAKVRYVE
ncbi:MAG: SufD family Fe-S cluster assembly protein, partial [Clostridia bacterium]|nr:SufD family Fe-S cluster assembly protein [Clostridia bacterium]